MEASTNGQDRRFVEMVHSAPCLISPALSAHRNRSFLQSPLVEKMGQNGESGYRFPVSQFHSLSRFRLSNLSAENGLKSCFIPKGFHGERPLGLRS
jgi:hypothetical protein